MLFAALGKLSEQHKKEFLESLQTPETQKYYEKNVLFVV